MYTVYYTQSAMWYNDIMYNANDQAIMTMKLTIWKEEKIVLSVAGILKWFGRQIKVIQWKWEWNMI